MNVCRSFGLNRIKILTMFEWGLLMAKANPNRVKADNYASACRLAKSSLTDGT